MWADAVLSAEKQHLLRLLMWAGLSIVAGTFVLAMLVVRRMRSPLLHHFAMQVAGWGIVVAIVALIGWRGLHLRDVAGAARLERVLWMNIGFDGGYVGIGATLAVAGYRLGRRLDAVGAGMGILLHGLALLVLDLQFAVMVSR